MAVVMPGILNTCFLGEWGAGLFPNAYEPASNAAIVLLLPVMAVFYLFSVSMPRSGGDYMYVSRTLLPVVGLVTSWTFSVTYWTWDGLNNVLTFLYGPAVDLISRGEMSGNQGMINMGLFIYNSPWVLWTGSVLLALLAGFIVWRGTKATLITFYTVWVLATIGLIVMIIAWLTMPSPDFFKTNMLKMTGVSYESIITTAQQNGWTSGFFVMPTLYAGVTYVMLNTLGNQGVVTVAGEVKEVRRSAFFALFGSLALMVIYWLPQYLVLFEVGGHDFTTASGYLFQIGKNPFIIEPVWTYMTAIASNNPWMTIIVTYTFAASCWAVGFGGLYFSTRAIFAWGFDRVFPSFANRVNSRGVPVGAVAVATFGCLVWSTLEVWFPQYLRLIGFTTTVWALAWVILGVAAMAFPYRRKDIFLKSPDIVRRKALGLPVIVHMGWMTILISAYIVYATFIPAISGVNIWYSFYPFLTTVIILMLIPVGIFYGYYYYRTRVGKVRMDIQFKEIPPD
jgi:amino acid transporter